MGNRWRHTLIVVIVLAAVGVAIAAFAPTTDDGHAQAVGRHSAIGATSDSLARPQWERALNAHARECQHPHGPFRVVGNRVLDSRGQRFVATGDTVYGLSLNGRAPTRRWGWSHNGDVQADLAQMRASARYWCANTVRIQLSPDALFAGFARTGHVDRAWVRALKLEVRTARQLGLNVVLTAQTEREYRDDVFVGAPMPTGITVRFWRYLAKLYDHDPDIFLDIFNEPRYGGWQTWYHGDRALGYIGMNQLASDVRRAGFRHQLLWIEGPGSSSTLARVTERQYRFRDPHGIVYAIHHPLGPHTVSSWQRDFGNVARSRPVVVGEWAQYASNRSECWPDAATAVPRFLHYIGRLHLGLIAWTLGKPGVLVRGRPGSAPLTMTRGTYSCTDAATGKPYNEGGGADLLRWFYAHNTRHHP